MSVSRFQTTRKRQRPVAADVSGAPPLDTPVDFSANWLLIRLGFDPVSFWQDPGNALHIDLDVAVETVAGAHADYSFDAMLGAWDDPTDRRDGGRAFLGRLIALSLAPQADWPFGRTWFHDLFTDLARLEGAIGIDLTSDRQMKHAVSSFWRRVQVLARTHAHSLGNIASPAPPPKPEWMRRDELTTPMKQLALF